MEAKAGGRNESFWREGEGVTQSRGEREWRGWDNVEKYKNNA